MGLLQNQEYWAARANDLFRLRPVPGQPLTPGQAQELFALACKTLSDILDDPDLDDDLKAAATHAIPVPSFESFVREFGRIETDLFSRAGADPPAIEGVLNELRGLPDPDRPVDGLRRLHGKLDRLRQLACDGYKDAQTQADRDQLVSEVRTGLIGVTLLGGDLGAIAALGPALGPAVLAAAGASISVGANAISKALHRWW